MMKKCNPWGIYQSCYERHVEFMGGEVNHVKVVAYIR